MRFLTTQPFIDRDAMFHPEDSVLEFDDDSDVIPSPDWRPMDEKAKERLQNIGNLKAAAKQAAEEKKNAIASAPKYDIVDGPVKKKGKAPREAQMTLKQASMEMDPPRKGRALDKSPV